MWLLPLVMLLSSASQVDVEQDRVTELEDRAGRLLERLIRADEEVRSLTLRSEAVANVYADSSERFMEAGAGFTEATRKANWATAVVIVGSLVPAAHTFVCAYSMTPERYRGLLSLAPGQDVDHRWPRSWWGIDNQLNYDALSAHQNRFLGARLIPKLSRPETWIGGAVTLFGRHCG